MLYFYIKSDFFPSLVPPFFSRSIFIGFCLFVSHSLCLSSFWSILGRVADPGGIELNLVPTRQIKPGPDSTVKRNRIQIRTDPLFSFPDSKDD